YLGDAGLDESFPERKVVVLSPLRDEQTCGGDRRVLLLAFDDGGELVGRFLVDGEDMIAEPLGSQFVLELVTVGDAILPDSGVQTQARGQLAATIGSFPACNKAVGHRENNFLGVLCGAFHSDPREA